MFNINDYNNEKNQIIFKMESVKSKIAGLSEMGIDGSNEIEKINSAIKNIEDDIISIVLVGAFSDGKTSVISGWFNERLDNMKIDSDESSDELLYYTPSSIPRGCQIVDTPGLFGDKIGMDCKGSQVAFSDITKKYISEANLILYVVSADNPIKDSHKEIIRWILKDLNKLSSTVFVINKMDSVADLTDDEDFQRQAKTKTDNLKGKLFKCGLSQDDIHNVKIVCICADPDGKGIEAWKNHYNEYLLRSRLNTLEKITNTIIADLGKKLITKTGCDVLNNEIRKMLEVVSDRETQISEIIIPGKKECLQRNAKDLENLYKKIVRSKKDIRDALKALQKKKINIIRATTIDNFRQTLEDEIGLLPDQEGYVLDEEINDIFRQYANEFSKWSLDLGQKFQAEYDKQNEFFNKVLSKSAAKASVGLKMAGEIDINSYKMAIFAGRDLLGKLGVVIKFKPWRVRNLAVFTKKALPILGSAIDVVSNLVENVSAQMRYNKFEKSKESVKDVINSTFLDIIHILDTEEIFVEKLAPSYGILKSQVEQDSMNIKTSENMLQELSMWRKDIDKILNT